MAAGECQHRSIGRRKSINRKLGDISIREKQDFIHTHMHTHTCMDTPAHTHTQLHDRATHGNGSPMDKHRHKLFGPAAAKSDNIPSNYKPKLG